MHKHSFTLTALFTYIGMMIVVTPVHAVSVCSGAGYCLSENQLCHNGKVLSDPECATEAFNGTACCLTDDQNTKKLSSVMSSAINPLDPPTNETFETLNPLYIAGGSSVEESSPSEYAEQLSTPGGIITRLLEFIFPIAGLILFLMISWGGFEVLSGANDSSKVTAGKQRVTAAIVGFLILFASYWMVQIMELVFGVVIF